MTPSLVEDFHFLTVSQLSDSGFCRQKIGLNGSVVKICKDNSVRLQSDLI